MAVELWIDDGNPWYLSPDIWVVPGSDPFAAVGQPTEDEPAYVWARVHNRGGNDVSDATVRFYWADPSTLITRASAALIGTSSASLAAGETKEVLCLTEWLPQFVNFGHECLLAEAFAATDPLPPHAPTDPFNVPTDRHVAQRNIGVAEAPAGAMIIYPFVAGAAGAGFGDGEAFVQVRREKLESLKPLTETLGVAIGEEAPDFEVGLVPFRAGRPVEEIGERRVELGREQPRRRAIALVGAVPDDWRDGMAALFLVEQVVGEEVVGGIAVLAQATRGDDYDKRAAKRGKQAS